jgi:hypothetical protein
MTTPPTPPPVPRIPPRIPPERCRHVRTRPGHTNPLPNLPTASVRVDYVECLDCGRHVSLTRSTPLPPDNPTTR